MTAPIPQAYPLYVTFEHIGRTYRVIGWEPHDGNYCPIIINTSGLTTGLGQTIHSLGQGTFTVTYHEEP